MTSEKCIHKGCGKVFTDPEEECIYHPGPPVFHEGQKGWKCCKPRVLTFDEFLSIPPCTTGKHSSVDDTPAPEPTPPSQTETPPPPAPKPISAQPAPTVSRQPQSQPQAQEPPAPPPESESDDASLPIPPEASCRRRGCNATYNGKSRDGEQCVHHPGHPIFHEGTKGYTCCKRRVLEFDEFMRIEGCKTKGRHLFIGSGGKSKNKRSGAASSGEELLETVRTDFYQTSTLIIASIYLKKILPPPTDTNKTGDEARDGQTSVTFPTPSSISLDLPTSDNKRYCATWPLFASVDTEQSSWKVMGTKLELNLVKLEPGQGWPVLRGDERRTGEIIQVGGAGRA